ncbi:MAG: SH3 domain-containing protein [Deltaproteobacteria bacterium]|nr:SH3 domain-containing protein [Deltaproteobacteria bacterium]
MLNKRKGFLCALFAVSLVWAGSASADRVRVTVRQANVRSEPGSRHRIVATTKEGDLLFVVDSGKRWWKVKLLNGKEGWIYKKAVHYEKDTYQTRIESMVESVLGPYLKWASLNEVYLEQEQTIRLDIMVTSQWKRLSHEERKAMMIKTAKALTKLCRKDELLKKYIRKAPYAVFFDRYNTPIGQANEVDARIIP